MYSDGEGVPQDREKAADWLEKAAVQGVAEAQYSLAYCYFDGNGVPKDENRAVYWAKKAVAQGLPEALDLLKPPPTV
jgi:TPR repeat protein